MNKNLHIFGFFSLMIMTTFMFSCEKETKLVEIMQEDTKLAVICNFNPDEPFNLQLSKTQSLLADASTNNIIENAEVQICQGNQLIEKISLFSSNNSDASNRYRSIISPKIQESYTLKIKVDGLEPISATSFIPSAVDIDHTSVGETVVYYSGSNPEPLEYKVRLGISFTDPIETNYYQVNFYQELLSINHNSLSNDSVIQITSNYTYEEVDKNLAYNFNVLDAGILFKDVEFNGTQQEFVFEPVFDFNPNNSEPINIIMELRTVSEEYYQFYSSVYRQNQQFNPEDELGGIPPFTDPATVFTNIKNGYGIFAGYSKVQQKTPIEF